MSNIPKNSKLWNMCVMQGKAKFSKWPSAAASAWVHKKYEQLGGTFVGSTAEMSASEHRDYAESEKRKEKDRSPHDTKTPAANSF